MTEKEIQHALLIDSLKAAGWPVDPPHIFIFGVAGTILQRDLKTFSHLGVTTPHALQGTWHVLPYRRSTTPLNGLINRELQTTFYAQPNAH